MNANAHWQLASPPESTAAPTSKIVQLDAGTQRQRQPDLTRHRFRLVEFLNRAGSKSWRVTGTKRNGERIRDNFPDYRSAQLHQIALEAEYHARAQDTELRATKLTDAQLRLAEAAFARLESDDNILPAVEYWRRHGAKHAAKESPRLDDAIAAFVEWLNGPDAALRPRTKANLRDRVTLFSNSIGNLRVADLTPEHIEGFLDGRNVTLRTKRNDRMAVSRFLRWCSDRKRRWIAYNPAREATVGKPEATEPQILTIEQCQALLRAAEAHKGGRLVPYLAVALFGALRPTEAARLTWDKVNLADLQITLDPTMTKTKRRRVVAIVPALAKWLSAYKGMDFYPPNFMKDFDAVRKVAGITTWPADVARHTGVSHFFRKTGSYGLTAEMAGNSEQVIKDHYQGKVSTADTARFYAIRPTAKPA